MTKAERAEYMRAQAEGMAKAKAERGIYTDPLTGAVQLQPDGSGHDGLGEEAAGGQGGQGGRGRNADAKDAPDAVDAAAQFPGLSEGHA